MFWRFKLPQQQLLVMELKTTLMMPMAQLANRCLCVAHLGI